MNKKETLMVCQDGSGHYLVKETSNRIIFGYWEGDSTWTNPGKILLVLDTDNSILIQDETDFFSRWVFYKYMEKYHTKKGDWISDYSFYNTEVSE